MNFFIFIIVSFSVASSLNIPEIPKSNSSSARNESASDGSENDRHYLIFDPNGDENQTSNDEEDDILDLLSSSQGNQSLSYIALHNFSGASSSWENSSDNTSYTISLSEFQLGTQSNLSSSQVLNVSLSDVDEWTTLDSQESLSNLSVVSELHTRRNHSDYPNNYDGRSCNDSSCNSTLSENSTNISGSGASNDITNDIDESNSEDNRVDENSENSEDILGIIHNSNEGSEEGIIFENAPKEISDIIFEENGGFDVNENNKADNTVVFVERSNPSLNENNQLSNIEKLYLDNVKTIENIKRRETDIYDEFPNEYTNYDYRDDEDFESNNVNYPSLRIVFNKDKEKTNAPTEKPTTTLKPIVSEKVNIQNKNATLTAEKSLNLTKATEKPKVVDQKKKIPVPVAEDKLTKPKNIKEDPHHKNVSKEFNQEDNHVDFDINENSKCLTANDIIAELNYVNNNYNFERPIWHSYTFNKGAYNREELRIIEVVAEKSFNLDKQIFEWISSGIHAVGLGPHGLTLLTSHYDGIQIDNHEYNDHVTTMAMFEWWNKLERAKETCLLTVHDATINWHHFRDDNQLDNLWLWKMNDPIIHLDIFMYNKKWKLAVTSEHGASYERSISIYGMDLWENWWFEQKFPGHGKPTIINDGKFIAVPQNDAETISIYKYNWETKMYECFKNFTSPNAADISAFTAGSNSFLAIGGEKSAIYQIMGDKFVEKTLHNYRLDHVELWLPISLGYFRNDVIVLFQHKLDHYSHSSSILEALQWNGEMFTLLEHSPCKSHEEEMFGFTCILDAEGEKGLKGAAVLRSIDDKISVITASEEYTPIMFEIKTELVAVPDPVDQEVENILLVQKALQDRLIAQQNVIDEAEKIIRQAVNHDEDSVTGDNWKIKELHAPAIRINGNLKDFLTENSYINLGGQNFENVDLDIDVTQMFAQIGNNHKRMKNVIHKLKNAVMKNEDLSDSMENVIIKGGISVRGKVQIKNAKIETLNSLNVEHALKDSVKISTDKKLVIKGEKILKNLKTKNVDVSNINGIEIAGPTARKFNPIIIGGDLVLPNRINILKDIHMSEYGTLNNINLKEDIYTINNKMKRNISYEKPLIFDSIKVLNTLIVEDDVNGYDFTAKGLKKTIEENPNNEYNSDVESEDEMTLHSLSVGKGFYFKTINGRSWSDYINRVVLKNENFALDKLQVTRSISMENGFNIETLNDIAFPGDYMMMNETSAIRISAAKTFTADVEATAVDCEGTVSGIDPQRIVTLNSPQNLDNFTFFDLTVTEAMNVNGEITGRDLDEFLSNPTLTDTNTIRSNVIFRSLQINGNVNVQNKINGSDWDNIAGDIILKTNEPLSIDSLKTFNGHIFVEKGLNVQSGFINNRRVKEFLTVDTDQVIENDFLNGDLRFETLTVGGTFDGVNIKELEQNVVRLSADQTVMADLTFENANNLNTQEDTNTTDRSLFNVNANSLKVTETCNEWKVPSDAVYINDEKIVLNSPEFNKVHIDHLIIEGNLHTTNSISGVNLNEFNTVRLSKTEDRIVSAPYTILSGKMNNLDFNIFNNMHKDQINNFIQQVDNVKEEIKMGTVNIGALHVSANLDVSKINGVNIREIAEDAVWLREENNITRKIKFVDATYAKHLKLNGNSFNKNFESYIRDIVNKDEESIVLTGKKTYTSGLRVQENITAEIINDIKATNLLNVYADQIIEGDVYIDGSVSVTHNIDVNKMVNNISMTSISETFKYLGNDEYYFNGSFYLEDDCQIDNLIVNGLINNMHNPEYILNSAINVYEDNHFENHIIFKKPVMIKNNLDIAETYNGVHLKTLEDNIVFSNEEAVINSSVIFKSPLTVDGMLKIHSNLNCETIQNCNMEEWKNNAIFLNNEQELKGAKHFKNLKIEGDIKVTYINDIPMNDIIPLNYDQTVSKFLKFDKVEVSSDLYVGGMINSMKLDEEFNNCLMMDGDQTIESQIHFHSNMYVTNDAYIKTINSKPLDNIVTLDSDQILYGTYNFKGKTFFDNNLNVSGMISDIDFDLWMKNAIFSNNYGSTDIKGNWNIHGDLHLKGNVQGKGVINGLDVQEINSFLKDKNLKGKESELDLIAKYKDICHELNHISEASNEQVYLFKYLEEIQTISSMEDIITHQFSHAGLNFILMSKNGFCDSDIWKWNTETDAFENIIKTVIGCVNKWYTTKQGQYTYLISLSRLDCNCKFGGVDLWSFDGINLQHIKNLPPADHILTPLREQGTYYSIENNIIHKYELLRKHDSTETTERGAWPIQGNLFAILPFKSANGIILTNGHKLTELPQSHGMVIGKNDEIKLTTANNDYFALADEILDFKVGNNRQLTAFVWSKETFDNSTEGAITIYENFLEGEIFQKISCYRPTSLTVIQLNNYQTLMAFIENSMAIKIYSYHGYQGFKYLYSLSMPANNMEVVTVNMNKYLDKINCLLVASNEAVHVIQLFMHGDRKKIHHVPCYL